MTNYTLIEGFELVNESTLGDENLRTFVRSYPNLAVLFGKLRYSEHDAIRTFLKAIPEHITCSKIEKAFTKQVEDKIPQDIIEDSEVPAPENEERKSAKEDFETESVEEEKEQPKTRKKKEGLSSKEIFNFLKARKELGKCKKEFGDIKVATVTKYMAKYYPNGIVADAPKAEEVEVKVEEKPKKAESVFTEEKKTEEIDYTTMTPLQLFNACKEKGIKAKIKQPKEYYLELLMPKEEKADSNDNDDDWDIEEEKVDEKSEKEGPESFEDDEIPESVPKKAKKEKIIPKKTEEEEEDEDWDI